MTASISEMAETERQKRQSQDGDLLSLPFDLYQRYSLITRLVALLWPRRKGRPLKILDVGGHSSPLKNFLPSHAVVLTDVRLPGSFTALPLTCDSYLLSSGTSLPLADLSFDLVVANDTLEHIPYADRPSFLKELLRVSRRFVVLNGPIHHPDTAEAEQRLTRFLQRALLEKSDFLQEHLDLGLPKREDIEIFLTKEKLPFIGIPNGNLMLWLTMNTAKNYILAFPHAHRLSETLDQTYNHLISPRDFGGLCYREAYVIAKSREDANTLQRVQAAFSPLLERPPIPGNIGALEGLVAAFEEHAEQTRRSTKLQETTIVELQNRLQRIETSLATKDAAIAERDTTVTRVETELADSQARLHGVQVQLQSATNTVGYRLLERVRQTTQWLAPEATRRQAIVLAFNRGLNIILTQGWLQFLRRAVQVWAWLPHIGHPPVHYQHSSPDDQYQLWLQAHTLTAGRARRIRRRAAKLTYRPLVSIIMPVYDPEPEWLRDAIESVRAQLYDRWELCISDDGSKRRAVRRLLEEYCRSDIRIKVTYLDKNQGIVPASNAALALASGEFVGFLDHDDELKPDALFEVARLLNERRDLDFIYSDEDKRDPSGRLVEPFFKPDWSPDLLMSVNYVTHFSVFRKELVDSLGGLRTGYDGSQDYDLVLRVTEKTGRIAHIPRPLYTWRKVPGSAAASVGAKDYAYRAAKKALAGAVSRRGLKAEIEDGPFRGWYRVKYEIENRPKVTIIIPTKDNVGMLRRCIDSIVAKTTYKNYDILVIDNNSEKAETSEYLSQLRWPVVTYPHQFNFAKIVNFGAQQSDSEFLLFLNNDTEVITPEWIEAMLEHGQRPDVAAVGARLLYPDGRVQHEGIIIGLGGGSAGNVDHGSYFGLGQSVRNCSAVTAACMLTRSSVFRELNGFDENLRVAFNDVDYCLRAREKGYRITYTPFSTLYHLESATRGKLHPEKDEQFFRNRWGKPGEYRDPYYNPNLDLQYPFTVRL